MLAARRLSFPPKQTVLTRLGACGVLMVCSCVVDPSFEDQPTITIRLENATEYELSLPNNGIGQSGAGWFELVGREDWLHLPQTSTRLSSLVFCDEEVPATAADILYKRSVHPGETLSIPWRAIRFDKGHEFSTIDGKRYCVDWEPVPRGRYRARFCAHRATYPCKPDSRALVRECVEVDLTVTGKDSTVDVVFPQPLFEKTDSYCDESREEAARVCATRALEDCERLGCRVLEARRVGEGGACGDSEQVGCAADTDCDGAITHARAPDGTSWRFTDACVPMGWTVFYPEDTGDLCE